MDRVGACGMAVCDDHLARSLPFWSESTAYVTVTVDLYNKIFKAEEVEQHVSHAS